MNRFGRDFFQICVDFHGGHEESRFRADGCGLRDVTLAYENFGRV